MIRRLLFSSQGMSSMYVHRTENITHEASPEKRTDARCNAYARAVREGRRSV